MLDHYAILGLQPGASQRDIKKAYKTLAVKYHPDKNPGKEEEAHGKFVKLQAAYEFLTGGNSDRIKSQEPETAPKPPKQAPQHDTPKPRPQPAKPSSENTRPPSPRRGTYDESRRRPAPDSGPDDSSHRPRPGTPRPSTDRYEYQDDNYNRYRRGTPRYEYRNDPDVHQFDHEPQFRSSRPSRPQSDTAGKPGQIPSFANVMGRLDFVRQQILTANLDFTDLEQEIKRHKSDEQHGAADCLKVLYAMLQSFANELLELKTRCFNLNGLGMTEIQSWRANSDKVKELYQKIDQLENEVVSKRHAARIMITSMMPEAVFGRSQFSTEKWDMILERLQRLADRRMRV
jgi:curved DNA-binding protein CbpA